MSQNINTTHTLYVAIQKIRGADFPRRHFFETIKERNAFVRSTDYTEIAGTVKLNDTQYAQFKQFGEWDTYAE